MIQTSIKAPFTKLKAIYDAEGPREALRFLNSLTEQRFTSLFRFDDDTLRSIVFYDRENPNATECDDIPVEASYCVFVRELKDKFLLNDSDTDPRVRSHPKRETVKCYCGVPLLDGEGNIFGSICNFDLNPGKIKENEVELLEYMAGLLRETA